jgi:hypothetical protein
MKHRRVYELLKRAGHSPAKALEIEIDAAGGDDHALEWVRILFRNRHQVEEATGRI